MIKSITVINDLDQKLKIELNKPLQTGIVVKSITGLGASKADVNMTEVVTNDGAIFNSSRLNKRNIVLSFLYCWTDDKSIEDVRQMVYKYFPIKKKITLVVETDNRTAYTTGYVESNEPDIFSQTEGTTISVICPDPFFYQYGADGKQVTVFSGVLPLFEFPFSNESLDERLLEVGTVQYQTEQVIYYHGDSDVGMQFIIASDGEVGDLTIYNVRTQGQMTLKSQNLIDRLGSGIVQGDIIRINTKRGEKGITLERNGTVHNILNCLDRNCEWFVLNKGDNHFAYRASFGGEFLRFSIENDVVYEGL